MHRWQVSHSVMLFGTYGVAGVFFYIDFKKIQTIFLQRIIIYIYEFTS